jgi:hypothetical protein
MSLELHYLVVNLNVAIYHIINAKELGPIPAVIPVDSINFINPLDRLI